MHQSVVCRNLLAREQRRIRSEYEERLRELERERQTVEEDKAQVRSLWLTPSRRLRCIAWNCHCIAQGGASNTLEIFEYCSKDWDFSKQSGAVQVDRYKGLLLKQRDIMIALTSRLNERDEQILMLQEELEAYDSHQK